MKSNGTSPTWFQPKPTGDPGADRIARSLQFACLLLFLAIGLVAILNARSHDGEEPLLALAVAGLAAAMTMNRAGRRTWAARTAVSAVLTVAVLLVLRAHDGFRSHAMLLFPAMLLIAVMLLDRRSYLVTAGAVLAAVAFLGIAEIQGVFRAGPPTRTPTSYATVFFVDLALFVFAAIGSRIAGDVAANVLDLRAAVERLSVANAELRESAGALRESEERARARAAELQATMDAVPAAIFIATDTECRRIGGNRSAYALLREPAGGNLSRSAPDGPPNVWVMQNGVPVPPSELPIQQAARTGLPIRNFEESMIFDDGSCVDLMVDAEPLLAEDGSPRGAVAVLTDITERRRAEAALRSSEERFRSLFENATVGIYRTTPQGRIDMANSALVRMLGYESFTALAERNLEAGGFEPRYSRAQFRKTVEERGEIHGLEAAWKRKDGTVLFVRESARCVRDDAGAVVHYEGSVEDITERRRAEDELRQSEAKFRAIVETSQEGICFLDVHGVTLYRSPSCQPIDGYSAEERRGRPIYEDVHRDDREAILGELAMMASGSRSTGPIPIRLRRKDGSWRWIEASARNLLDNPNVRAIVVAVRDVTEQRRAEEERERLRQQLAHAQKMESVGRLAGGIAHDFNNLMSVIVLHAESALEAVADSQSTLESVTAIAETAEKAIALGRQLMAFSSKRALQTEVLTLDAALGDTQKLVRRLIGKDVNVVFKPGSGRARVSADRGQLAQIVMNLAVNARDAMPEGGTFTIETSRVAFDETDAQRSPEAAPGVYAALTIRDTGLGMDAETRRRAFEPFYTTKGVGEGTGLGLSVVYGIVKQMGGFIAVESEPGKGTEFRICVPVVPESQGTVVESKTATIPGGSETILLAEDEAALREKVRQVLEGAGYRVIVAEDGHQAVRLGLEHIASIRLLVTDVIMPEMSGYRVVERLQAIRPQLRHLYITGYPEADHRSSGGGSPQNAVYKPFTKEKLLRSVREALDG